MAGPSAEITLQASNLTKKFNNKIVFENISFELSRGSSLAITGRNGSGKSTLLKIAANLIESSSGEIDISLSGEKIKRDLFYKYIGFSSPYLNLYDEFSAYENLKIISDIRGSGGENIDEVLKRVGLDERKDDLVKIYSSGMKQRLKLAFSIFHNPEILLLDEPTTNLDQEGVKVVEEICNGYKERILMIATNDEHEKSFCSKEVNLNR
jgi:heme exporter protein A